MYLSEIAANCSIEGGQVFYGDDFSGDNWVCVK